MSRVSSPDDAAVGQGDRGRRGLPADAALVAAWPTLPDPLRRAVLALVGAAATGQD